MITFLAFCSSHLKVCVWLFERWPVTRWGSESYCSPEEERAKGINSQRLYNTTSLPSVNTLIARGMFFGAKHTHHTFTPIIKHLITTTANKHPGKKSFIDKNMKNPTGIKLCISHKIATSRGPPLKSYCPSKSRYRNYLQQIN